MDDRPFLLADRVHAEIGEHAAGIGIVRPAAEQPLVAHVGECRIGAAEHHGLAGLENVRRHRMVLRRADRAEKGDDVGLRREFRESQHRAGIGGLVVFGDQFDRLAENAAGLVDLLHRDLRADQRVAPGIRRRPRYRENHADLRRRALRMRAAQKGRHGDAGSQSRRDGTSRESHAIPPIAAGATIHPRAALWRRWRGLDYESGLLSRRAKG